MNFADLLMPAAVAGFVLVACAMVLMRRGNRPGLTRTVMRRMSRPDVALSDDITKTDRYRRNGREFLSWLYRINLFQKLEENLWQAGIYPP